MIEVTKHTRDVLLGVAKKKRIYIEGNFLKILQAPKGDTEFEEYLKLCKEKDSESRRKRLKVKFSSLVSLLYRGDVDREFS